MPPPPEAAGTEVEIPVCQALSPSVAFMEPLCVQSPPSPGLYVLFQPWKKMHV